MSKYALNLNLYFFNKLKYSLIKVNKLIQFNTKLLKSKIIIYSISFLNKYLTFLKKL